jgi:phage terminase small subunit
VPRRSAASLTIAAFSPGLKRLDPPSDLQGTERQIWIQTVASLPASHFLPEDAEILRAYCASAALARRAATELQASPLAGDRPTPWLKVHGSAVRSMAQMSVRLRLGPRSRDHNVRSGKTTAREPSYYELMDMGQGKPTAARPPVGIENRWR